MLVSYWQSLSPEVMPKIGASGKALSLIRPMPVDCPGEREAWNGKGRDREEERLTRREPEIETDRPR